MLSIFTKYIIPGWAVLAIALIGGLQNNDKDVLDFTPGHTMSSQEFYESLVTQSDYPGCVQNDRFNGIPSEFVIVVSDTREVKRVAFTERFWNQREAKGHWIVLSCK